MQPVQEKWQVFWGSEAIQYECATLWEASRSVWLPLLYMLLGLWAVVQFWGQWPVFWGVWAFILLAVPLLLIDFKHFILPDLLVFPGIVCGLIVGPTVMQLGVANSWGAAAFGFGLFYLVRWGFAKARGIEGMGYGDVKLMAMLGAWTGWLGLPLIFLVSSILGLLAFGLRYVVRGDGGDVPLPFGPFLLAGAWLALLYSDMLWRILIEWRGVWS